MPVRIIALQRNLLNRARFYSTAGIVYNIYTYHAIILTDMSQSSSKIKRLLNSLSRQAAFY